MRAVLYVALLQGFFLALSVPVALIAVLLAKIMRVARSDRRQRT